MFEKILNFIKEAWRRLTMIGQADLKSALKIDAAISPEMATALDTWRLMYTNQSPWMSKDVRSLGLAAAIASEIARSVTIEMKVELSGSARAKYLQEQIERVLPLLRERVEYGLALGGMAFKPYVTAGKIAVDFVAADSLLPVAFDGSGHVTGMVFVDQRTVGDKYYTRLEYHRLNGTEYSVQNLAYVSTVRDQLGRAVDLAEIAEWAELRPVTVMANIQKPLFGYFRVPLANHIDPRSPMGVSCYARAVDTIEEADKLYSNLLWEFKSGKRKMVVDRLSIEKDPTTGKPIYPTEEDRNLFLALDASGSIGEANKLFDAWSPEFREASILSGLDALLKKIEFQAGLAFGTLSDPQSVEKTATEIQSAKQRSASTVVDNQKALKAALEDLFYAMDVLITITPSLALSVPRGAYTAAFDFDDSLVVDRDAQKLQDRQDVTLGVMSKWRYLMHTRGLSEAEAKAWIAETQAEQPQEPAFGGR
jgi:A118 family predicted phage portal protein